MEARDTFGLVGESGSGKTTIARIILGAEQASAGEIRIADHRYGVQPANDAADAWRQPPSSVST